MKRSVLLLALLALLVPAAALAQIQRPGSIPAVGRSIDPNMPEIMPLPPLVRAPTSAKTPSLNRGAKGISPAPSPGNGPTFEVTTIERIITDAAITHRRNTDFGRGRNVPRSCFVSSKDAKGPAASSLSDEKGAPAKKR